ncbi:MAG TPA: IS200/IS605 family transposase [Planctomycetota bacterium]|nr:IS200/IS605 family transposase [Planctomycetota bacterium]
MGQSYSSILIHTVFSTKHREPTIPDDIAPELYKYMATVLKTNECPALIIGGTNNHVHLLHTLSRTIAMSSLIEELKSDSSKWIKQRSPLSKSFYWQSGYGAFSIGQSGVAALEKYIRLQKQHHEKKTFEDELRELCVKYNVKLDERYAWN